jgi:hypothetical protein
MCVIKIHAFTSIGRPPLWSGTRKCRDRLSQIIIHTSSYQPPHRNLSPYSPPPEMHSYTDNNFGESFSLSSGKRSGAKSSTTESSLDFFFLILPKHLTKNFSNLTKNYPNFLPIFLKCQFRTNNLHSLEELCSTVNS